MNYSGKNKIGDEKLIRDCAKVVKRGVCGSSNSESAYLLPSSLSFGFPRRISRLLDADPSQRCESLTVHSLQFYADYDSSLDQCINSSEGKKLLQDSVETAKTLEITKSCVFSLPPAFHSLSA